MTGTASATVNLGRAFEKIQDRWAPKIVAQVNDFHVKLVKIEGEFIWHSHPETDELFLVYRGELFIDYRDRRNVVREGELFVVPKGVEHRPVAEQECEMLLFEPAGTSNRGDAEPGTTGEWLTA